MDTKTNNYSLSNTNGLTLFKDLIFLLMELTGESLGSLYDRFTLDAPQAVKRQIDSSVEEGHLGQIIKVIQELLKETKYFFNTSAPNKSNSDNNNNTTTNNFNSTITKSFSSPNFYSTNCNSEENISLSSTPNGSSIYSTPSNSTFLSSSSPTKQPFIDSANSTPTGNNSPTSNSNNSLSAEQIKIKQLELELLKFKEAAAAMMNLKANNNNNNNISSPSKSMPPPVSVAPPPPPPPPPVFKQPTPINLRRGQSSPNLSTGTTTQPPQFNISEILSKKPLLKKVNLDRSPGGTPSKERPKSGVEDVFKAILHKFKNENNHQSPCKGQTDDESSDSDFE